MTLYRPLHRSFAPALLALVAFSFTACVTDDAALPATGVVFEDENVLIELDSETVVAPETVRVADLLESGAITEPPEVTAPDEVGESTVVLVTPAGRPADGLPGVGDVLVAGPSDSHPYGYARFVQEVRELGGGRFELRTRVATLAEIFEQLDFRMNVAPDRDAWQVSTVSDIGRSRAELTAGGTIDLAPMIGVPGEGGLRDIACGGGGARVQIDPTLSLTPTFDTEVETRFGRLRSARFIFEGRIDAGIAAELRGETGVVCEWTGRLGPAAEFTGVIPGTAVVITHRVQPQVTINVSATAGLSGRYEATGSVGFRVGVEKPRGGDWSFISEGSRDGNIAAPEVEFGDWEVSITVEPTFTYALFVYDAFGPDMSLKLPLQGSIAGDRDGCITADLTAGLTGSVGVELQVPVLDITIASASASLNLIEASSFPSFPRQYGTCAPDPCTDAGRSCSDCNQVAGCGWCNGACQSDTQATACGEDWRSSPSACEPCEATSCGECATSGFCGWCPGAGCVNLDVPSEVALCGADLAVNPGECGPR